MNAMPTIPNRSSLLALMTAVAALTACGGGSGGDTPAASAPPPPAAAPTPAAPPANAPAAVPTLAACLATPADGTVNWYLNTSRQRREWKPAVFLGESVTGRFDYATSTSTVPVRVRYSRPGNNAGELVVLGTEWFDAAGNLTRREQYSGWVISSGLAEGVPQTQDYNVRTLFPAGQPDRTERLTRVYDGVRPVTLGQGQISSCQIRDTLEQVTPSGPVPLSAEQLHYVPSAGWIKSYYTVTQTSAPDVRQTYLTELAQSNRALAISPAPAGSQPGLLACATPPQNRTKRLTASNAGEAASAVRMWSAGVFNGSPVMVSTRMNVQTNAVTQRRHFDPALGALRTVGREQLDPNTGSLVESFVRTGTPNLSTLAVGSSASFTSMDTYSVPAGLVRSNAETVTFLGHERVSTPAGTFDTWKLRWVTGNGSTAVTETYHYAPNTGWVRLDSESGGVRTTRELLSLQ